jgi:hypothetical protein
MSKNTYLFCVACFLAGLLLGVVGSIRFAATYWGKQVAYGLTVVKEKEVFEAEQRAFEAYQHETPLVAIYALNQYLAALKKAEVDVGHGSVLMTKRSINSGLIFTHARLAKVCAEAGQSDISAQHAAEALRCAGQDSDFRFITNRATLSEVLSGVDKGAKK